MSSSQPKSSRQVGLKYGFRSGLEERVAEELGAHGVPFSFEELKVPYMKPARMCKYTPDFILPSGIIVETKGRFVTADRQKHLLLQDQEPDLDIRFVFSRSKSTISKQSKTTYAKWCEDHGFLYADKSIPLDWLEEAPNEASLAVIRRLQQT